MTHFFFKSEHDRVPCSHFYFVASEVLFARVITVASGACLFLCRLFFPLNVQNLAVSNDFRSVMPVSSEKSFAISHAGYGMVIAEPFSDRHETAGVRPQL